MDQAHLSHLFNQVSEGDASAFATLFKTFAPKFEPFILGITRNPDPHHLRPMPACVPAGQQHERR
jgi:hypothetical protein